MPNHATHALELDDAPEEHGQLSTNAHWLFGSLYALMALVGFSFGIWAGAQKPRPVEVVDAKKDDAEKPSPTPAVVPAPAPESKPKEPEPMPPPPAVKEPDPTPKEPEPKPKEPEPTPKPKEPTPKPKDIKPVVFKDVVPVLRKHCFDCHGAVGKPKGGVDVTSLAKMLASKGEPLVPGKPEESTIYTTTASGEMPKDRKGPDEEELKLLHDWIAGGARERRRTVRRGKLALTRGGGAG
jgi:periplasmic protein TonB